MSPGRRHHGAAGVLLSIAAIGMAAILLSAPALGTELSPEEISDLYSQAKELFRSADALASTDAQEAMVLYKRAAMRFERIVREGGIQNGKLYYNIGNIYFRTRDIGRAILNYRRAQQYIPNDPNLQQNLDFARSRRLDRVEEKQETRILKTLFFWHYDLATRTRVFVFSFSFMLLWVFAATRIFLRKAFLAWCIAFAAALSVLFAVSLVSEFAHLEGTRPGVVISSEVIARKGNSETYQPSFKEPLHAGTEFALLEDRGSWYHIELPDARRCWVPDDDVELVR